MYMVIESLLKKIVFELLDWLLVLIPFCIPEHVVHAVAVLFQYSLQHNSFAQWFNNVQWNLITQATLIPTDYVQISEFSI